jgi:hypothetical protein
MTATEILDDPRWDDDPVALWDEIMQEMGYERAVAVWKEACREADRAAEEAERLEESK